MKQIVNGLVQTSWQVVPGLFLKLHVADGVQTLGVLHEKTGLFEGGTTEFPVFHAALHRDCSYHWNQE